KCDNTRPKVSMHWSGADCPVVAMKRCNARGAKGAGHSAGKQVNGQPDEPGSTGRRQPSTSGTSRVKREFQARFCERLRVRFPRPTRQGRRHPGPRRGQPREWEEPRMKPKSFDIPKALVWEAYEHVKANGGAAGVDHETIEKFEERLGDKLYKLWNRMCSGSYFPPPVKAVPIPKKTGGVRVLGVPTHCA